MRRLSLLALAAFAACTPPMSRPAVGPVPAVSGPDGESPVPTGAINPVAVAVAPASNPVDVGTAGSIDALRSRHLLVPVAGADATRLEDSFEAGRDGDRQHNAIDILAPRNTPILAADGVILRMSSNALGGITIYARDPSSSFVYYYAHLDHYFARIHEGDTIAKGDTLGFVGTTGNAPKDVPHLHFQIMRWPADGKYWNGEPINPFPLLHVGGGASGKRGRRFD